MESFRLLKRYHAYLAPTLLFFSFAIFFDVVVIGLGILNPMFTKVLFDYAYQFRNLTLLNVTIIAIVVSYFLYFFLSVLSDYLQTYVSQEASAKLTTNVFYAIQCLPLRFHQEKKSGDLLIRITDDVSNTISVVMALWPTVVIDFGRLLIIFYIAYVINPTLTLLALFSIPLYAFETKFYARRLQGVEEELVDVDSDIYSRAQERIGGIKTVKAFGQEYQETLSFGSLIRRRYKIQVKEKALSILRTFTNSITLQMWTVVITWYLGYQIVQGKLTIGEVVALMLYLEQLSDPIEAISNFATSWKTNMVSMRRINEVLTYPSELSLSSGDKNLEIRDGDVKSEHLSFSYVENQDILHEIDLHFPPASLSAIVGESGGGKTTLVNLLMRFFDASKGKIMIDNQNILEVRIRSLRDRIGMISQEYLLFDGTVIENILYGNPGKTKEDAIKVARLASAYDFIMKLPDGFESSVGPSGSLLSGGQRQRIAIARTLLKDPDIIIFDEATSALDPESEFHIQEAINKLKAVKTVIVIAHRLSTIKSADQIMVLEGGSFVERGSFNELLEKRGAFYRFYWKQFGGLAYFRQQLFLEMERAARYDSHFCIAVLRLLSYQKLAASEGTDAADKLMDEIDSLIKSSIRVGDNSSVFEGNTILMLLPELLSEQVGAFFSRVGGMLTKTFVNISNEDILLLGTRIKSDRFKSPEELIGALIKRIELLNTGDRTAVVDEKEL